MKRRRRSMVFVLLILLVAIAAGLGGLGWMLSRQPAFYDSALKDDFDDSARASDLFTRVTELQQDIRISKPEFGASFTADEINSFLRIGLAKGGSLEGSLDSRVQDPRVAIDGDKITIAARYQAMPFEQMQSENTKIVVSVELRAWVVSKRQNTIAVEVVRCLAGGVPVGAQRYLDRMSEVCRDANIDVTWYRMNGNPVGLFQLYADQVQPTTQVRLFKIDDKKITLSGKSILETAGP
ncbi:MAG: hypothetical protein ACRC8S_03000 [Fimbriiglobus sp.]